LALCFVSLIAGCDKVELTSTGFIGKWEWLYTTGGIIGRTYPNEGDIVVDEYTEDSILVRRVNGKIILETDFHVSGDTLWYWNSTIRKYESHISRDTLRLIDLSIIAPSFIHVYKRLD
jgi:signal peptidase I